MPIELRLLRCALALAEHHNFVRAAEACYLSQPSLSRNIQEIERRVGTKLFERAAGGVLPTDAGKIFLEQAREVVVRSADLGREMNLLRGLEKGELRIGAGTYPSVMMVDKAVTRLVRTHPAIRLHIKIDNWASLLPLIMKRELDLAVIIVDGMGEEPELHITRMNRHQGYFVVRSGHPLATASKKALTLQQLLQFPVVMSSRLPPAMLKRLLVGTFGDNPDTDSMKSFPSIACDSIPMMKTIIADTDAVSVLPLSTVISEVQSRQFVILSLVAPWFDSEFGVVRLAHRSLSPIGETFVRMLQEEDEKVLKIEKKAIPKLFGAPRSARPRARPVKSAASIDQ
jgi:DNA-binding transcriptional LysR family regulator